MTTNVAVCLEIVAAIHTASHGVGHAFTGLGDGFEGTEDGGVAHENSMTAFCLAVKVFSLFVDCDDSNDLTHIEGCRSALPDYVENRRVIDASDKTLVSKHNTVILVIREHITVNFFIQEQDHDILHFVTLACW